MTTQADYLVSVDGQLKWMVPFDPSRFPFRGTLVVVIGEHWFDTLPLDYVVHGYRTFSVYPPRPEEPVRVYLMLEEKSSNQRDFAYLLLDWPYFWRGSGASRHVVFPGRKALRLWPVKEMPSKLVPLPKKVGSPRVLRPSELPSYLRRLATASRLKLRKLRNRQFYPKRTPYKRLNPETIYWNGINGHDDYWTLWTQFPVQTLRYYRAYSSVDTPEFRRLKKSQLPVNPYSLTLIKVADPVGHDLRIGLDIAPYGPMMTSRAYAPSSNWTQIPAAPVHDALAYDKALKNLIDHAEFGLDGNLAQDLAQFTQTTSMIGDSARRIATSVSYVKKHRFKEAWSALMTSRYRGPSYKTALPKGVSVSKGVAENWLALQYGWKPLLQDIDASMRSLANYMIQTPHVVRVAHGKGKASSQWKTDLTFNGLKTGEAICNTKTFCTIGIRYSVDNKLRSFLAQTGFTNPINLAWEILPYSFVVDWFFPIGPYLTTLSAFDGLSFVDGFVSKFTRQYFWSKNNFWNYISKSPSFNVIMDLKSDYWREYVQVDRVKLWSFPEAEMPQFKNPISVTHALNGLSLLRAAFS